MEESIGIICVPHTHTKQSFNKLVFIHVHKMLYSLKSTIKICRIHICNAIKLLVERQRISIKNELN